MMKKISLLPLLAALLLAFAPKPLSAQNPFANDSLTAQHYNICLDMGHLEDMQASGYCEVDLIASRDVAGFDLGLENASVSAVLVNGSPVEFSYDGHAVRVAHPMAQGSSLLARVDYQTNGWIYSDGGFWMDPGIYYNLGQDRYSPNWSMGRSWFPCIDNPSVKATFHLSITAKPGWYASCSGNQDSVVSNADGSKTFHYTLPHPVATYHVGIDVAPYHVYTPTFHGYYGDYPSRLACFLDDSATVQAEFDFLNGFLYTMESLFGPYRWGSIGFSETPQGGMEHVGNVATGSAFDGSEWTYTFSVGTQKFLEYLIYHEFAHQWFGDIITCATTSDLWFNEGGATFCETFALEQLYGKAVADGYRFGYKQDYLYNHYGSSLCEMPSEMAFINGMNYYKGMLTFQDLRSYLGDTVFFHSLKTLFDRNEYTAMTTSQICDSLSLYSGVDLHDFFAFHLYSEGWMSYSVAGLSCGNPITVPELGILYPALVTIQQQQFLTDDVIGKHRLPVTFFHLNNQGKYDTCTQNLMVNGTRDQVFAFLPFRPDFATIDYAQQTSNAAFSELIYNTHDTTITSELTYTQFQSHGTVNPSQFLVTVQWAGPKPNNDPAIRYLNSHRWDISGNIQSDDNSSITARFAYERNKLDYGFYHNMSTLGVMALLYRPDFDHRWEFVSMERTGQVAKGYFIEPNLRPGQYILAVVDTANIDSIGQYDYVGILTPNAETAPKLAVWPNPANGQIHFDIPGESVESVEILSVKGSLISSTSTSTPGSTLDIQALPSGIYFLRAVTRKGTATAKFIKR